MTTEMIALLGGAGTVLLGGSLIKAVLDYVLGRGKTRADVAVSMITSLQAENARLQHRLAELEGDLDTERAARRQLETDLHAERTARRKLEDRVAALEGKDPHA